MGQNHRLQSLVGPWGLPLALAAWNNHKNKKKTVSNHIGKSHLLPVFTTSWTEPHKHKLHPHAHTLWKYNLQNVISFNHAMPQVEIIHSVGFVLAAVV